MSKTAGIETMHIATVPPAEPELEERDEEWEYSAQLAKRLGLRCLHIHKDDLDYDLISAFPAEVLSNYLVLPLSRDDDELTLAMADPLDVVAEDMIRLISGCYIQRVVAMGSEILDAVEGRMGQTESEIEGILNRIPTGDDLTVMEQEQAEDGTVNDSEDPEMQAPIIQLVSSIVCDAIRMGASDIHIEPSQRVVRVRYRMDGHLRLMMELPKRVQNSCTSRIKLMGGIDISECRKPQDGRARVIFQGRQVDLRVSCLPTFHGEKIVMRILDAGSVIVTVDRLGFNEKDFENVNRVLNSSQGLILVTGPTGSGKTSTLYSALAGLNMPSENIVTVEDPVEYQLEGINQVQVNVRAGLTFAAALRSILRQDPDVVLLGEIRDLETAEIAVQAAQTGHLVLSTLHTNDAVSTVGRLVNMGVAPYLLASSLLCVVAQRLVRKLCTCRVEGSIPEDAKRLLAVAGYHSLPEKTWIAQGCEKCHHTGYKGRMGIFEILSISDRVRELLLANATQSQILKLARSEGMKSLLEDGLAKCAEGLTSMEEVLRVVTVQDAGGKQCAHCGLLAPPEFPICVFCGEDLVRSCGNCQHPVEAEWRVCPGCREPLAGAPAVRGKKKPSEPVREEEPALMEQVGPPVYAPLAPPEEGSRGGEAPSKGLVTVLTADMEISSKLSRCLQQRGYGVDTVCDMHGVEALLRLRCPDVIVLDYCTPELDATHFVADLRSRLQTSSVQFILLTERGPGGVQGLASGADEFLLKPLDEGRVATRVAQAMLSKNRRGMAA